MHDIREEFMRLLRLLVKVSSTWHPKSQGGVRCPILYIFRNTNTPIDPNIIPLQTVGKCYCKPGVGFRILQSPRDEKLLSKV